MSPLQIARKAHKDAHNEQQPSNFPPMPNQTKSTATASHTPVLSFFDVVPHYRESNAFNAGIWPEGYGVDIYDIGGTEPFAKVFASVGHGQSNKPAEQEAEARAAFIVRACNSHAALVAALESFIACELKGDAALYLDQARAAIQSATL